MAQSQAQHDGEIVPVGGEAPGEAVPDDTAPRAEFRAYVAEPEPEEPPARPQSNFWYFPLTGIIVADVILWRLAVIAPSPARWICLAVALALVVPIFRIAVKCPAVEQPK